MPNTPIAFIIFSRPELTQKSFDEIQKIKPKKLFIIADGLDFLIILKNEL